MAVVTYYWW